MWLLSASGGETEWRGGGALRDWNKEKGAVVNREWGKRGRGGAGIFNRVGGRMGGFGLGRVCVAGKGEEGRGSGVWEVYIK